MHKGITPSKNIPAETRQRAEQAGLGRYSERNQDILFLLASGCRASEVVDAWNADHPQEPITRDIVRRVKCDHRAAYELIRTECMPVITLHRITAALAIISQRISSKLASLPLDRAADLAQLYRVARELSTDLHRIEAVLQADTSNPGPQWDPARASQTLARLHAGHTTGSVPDPDNTDTAEAASE